MMDNISSPSSEDKSVSPDTLEFTAEVQDSQQPSQLETLPAATPPQLFRNSFTPSESMKTPQTGSVSFTPEGEKTPIESSPQAFNTYHNTDSPKRPRPNFFNPSNGPVSQAPQRAFNIPKGQPVPQSIFGPPLTSIERGFKNEDKEYDHDGRILQPLSPYREQTQSQVDDSPPNPQSRSRSPTWGNETNFNGPPSTVTEQLSTRKPSMDLDSDSDGDLEIIDADQASSAAKTRWRDERPWIRLDDEETQTSIKTEPTESDNEPIPSRESPCIPTSSQPAVSARPNTTDMAAVLARQRAMLNKSKAAAKGSHASQQKPVERVASPRMTNEKKRHSEGQVVPDDPTQVEAAMRAGSDEDHSWMHEEADDSNSEEMEILKEKIETLSRREANGKINENEILELLRLRKYMRLQQRLVSAARRNQDREPQEESLFVPSDRDELLSRKRRDLKQREGGGSTPDMDTEGEDDANGTAERDVSEEILSSMLQQELNGDGLDGAPPETDITKAKQPKKPRKKVAKNAREFFTREEEELREKARSKSQKQKAKAGRGGRKPAGRGRSPAGKKGKGAAKGRKSGGHSSGDAFGGMSQSQAYKQFKNNDGIDLIGQMMVNGLMDNDPISERLQNPIFNAGTEPEIHGTHRKSTQLQRLISNIPEGSSAKEARSDKTKLLQASRSFGYAQVKAVNGKWLIKGMRSTLYHHQLLGAQWMIKRELSDEAPYGGLLADGMGLGKTVQTLACMVGNPPSEKEKVRQIKATLIVVPSAVIDQWLDEIRNHAHVATFPKIMRYRAASKIPVEVLRDLDIVVTSYQEVMRQFPFPDEKDREKISRIGYKNWWKKASKNMGDLFNVYWYRVVLDEAHAIKNNMARTSLACQSLRSIFRWCLTGTPLLNRLEELFPYLRFLKANYTMDWKTFQRYFCDPDAKDCNTRIATLLSYTMMRRTMKTTIMNRAIITLPTPHPEIRYVQFSAEERIIYRITENRFRAILNVHLANGTAGRNYAVFLVQLLRLRQCTSHPFMLERTIRESWTSSDLKELRKGLKNLSKMTGPFYEQCQVWIGQSERERQAAIDRGEDPTQQGVEEGESMRFGVGDYGHSFDMGKALKTLSEEDAYNRVTCWLCSDFPTSPQITDCGHIFCKECLSSYMHHKTGLSGDDDYMTCPFCDKIFVSFRPYTKLPNVSDEDDIESSPNPSSSQGPKSKKRKERHGSEGGPGVDALGFEPKVAFSTWVDKSQADNFPLAPSAKTAALKAILLKGFQDAPTDKVVIYVQFRLLAKIVARICASERWGFVYLMGECTLDHRSKVINTFRDDDGIKILISGLKCGGQGLNFPWANRCISLDLWWNHAVEQQAFGRIFRIGQKKETYMSRIIVKNSVDMRLLSMQLHKLKACEEAVGNGEEKQKPSLSLKELAQLFGFLRTDDDGEIVSIEPDYQDDD